MRADGDGIILGLASIILNFEYASASANLIGARLLSSLLLSLAAGNSAAVQSAIATELESSSVSSKAADASIS